MEECYHEYQHSERFVMVVILPLIKELLIFWPGWKLLYDNHVIYSYLQLFTVVYSRRTHWSELAKTPSNPSLMTT